MLFNGVNYGSYESFSKHSGVPVDFLKNMDWTFSHERDITTHLGIRFTRKLIFLDRVAYYNLEDLYVALEDKHSCIDKRPYQIAQEIRQGVIFDHIIDPSNLQMVSSRD